MTRLRSFNFLQWAKCFWDRILRLLGPPPARSLLPASHVDSESTLSSVSNLKPTQALILDFELESRSKSTFEDIAVIDFSTIESLLQNFVSGAAEVQGAALVSPDGLSLATVLPSTFDEERTAAMSASMLSLGERIGEELSRGVISRILVEGDQGYSILVGCGDEGILLVLASQNAKQGVLFLEIKRLVSELIPQFS